MLSYEDTGDASSSIVVIFFHGVFSVGSAPIVLSPVLVEKKVHYVAPTLTGWGFSSPRLTPRSYAKVLKSDMTELINHLHPNTPDLRIYVGGTVAAQMLYGASLETFPRQHIRTAMLVISLKLKTVDKAEAWVRQHLFENAAPEEQAAFARWCESQGLEEGVYERRIATNMVKSISKSWAGFIEVANALCIHSNWGFRPDLLDEEHTSRRPMMISAFIDDDLGPGMATWLVKITRIRRSSGFRGSIYQRFTRWMTCGPS
ncbi:hypothetical protein B0H11DRAFT_2213352 [Mycena galericulata]|nr:hypothetical protein B0H11DRAFT_2213352 [Mycena galericulata]